MVYKILRRIILKKFIYIFLVIVILFSLNIFAEESVSVRVNNNFIVSDVSPLLIDGRTYLPLRAILNAIGVENKDIIWWELSESVEIRHQDIHIFMPVGSGEVIVNDSIFYTDSPAFIKDKRTFVPVRFLSETLNCRVDWDGINFIVDIYTN